MTHAGGKVKAMGRTASDDYVEIEFAAPPETKTVFRGDVTTGQWELLLEDFNDATPQPSTVSAHIAGTPPVVSDVKRVKP